MKSIAILLTGLFAGLATLLSAQPYHPFPIHGTWIYQRIDDFGHPTPDYDQFVLAGDTSIASHEYKKLTLNSHYHGALRDSVRRIYFRSAEDSIEHVLYDFNKTTGDTILNPYPLEPLGITATVLL